MENNLIIASQDKKRILLWKQRLKGFIKTSITIDRLDVLLDEVVRIKPDILLLDIDLLCSNCMGGVSSLNAQSRLRMLCTETSVILLSGGIDEDMEWQLLNAGVRGFCRHEISSELLGQVVNAVQLGELWVRRKLISRLADKLVETTSKNEIYRASHDLVNKLTQREYDIALRVGEGKSNKQIAQMCRITERTVKAHLSEVFHKLGISDRINLALIISANDTKNLSVNKV